MVEAEERQPLTRGEEAALRFFALNAVQQFREGERLDWTLRNIETLALLGFVTNPTPGLRREITDAGRAWLEAEDGSC